MSIIGCATFAALLLGRLLSECGHELRVGGRLLHRLQNLAKRMETLC
jgi:hypothetical protein